jgi:AI-2 transport protein TqsA
MAKKDSDADSLSLDHSNAHIVLLAFIALIGVVFVLVQLFSILLPLVLATLLSLVFKPFVAFLRRYRIPLGICIIIVVVCIAGIITFLSYIAVTGVQRLIADAPRYEDRFNYLLGSGTDSINSLLSRLGHKGTLGSLAESFQFSSVTGFLASSLGSVLTGVTSAVLTLLFTVFLLMGSEDFPAKVQDAFSSEQSEKLTKILARIHQDVHRYIFTKTLVNLIVATGTVLILLVFGVDFPLLTGVVAFFLAFIPNFGSVIAAAIPAIICILQFNTFGIAFLVIACLIVYQNFVGNFLEPKMMGSSLNLSPLVVLLSLIFWGWVWGVWGMVLAVPITSIIKIICEHVATLRPISVLMSTGGKRKLLEK